MRVNCRKCDISVKFAKCPYITHMAKDHTFSLFCFGTQELPVDS